MTNQPKAQPAYVRIKAIRQKCTKEVKKLMSKTFPLLENYLSYMEAALGRSENTVKEYRYDLILFARFLKPYNERKKIVSSHFV